MDQKEVAIAFLQSVVSGDIDEAYEKYADMQGSHHNLFSPTGLAGLRDAMKENESAFPHKQLKIQHVLSEGEFVAVHSHLLLKPDTPGMIVVHLFRFQNGKIAEVWDCGQEIPIDSPNKDGAF